MENFKKIIRVGKKRVTMYNRKNESTYRDIDVFCKIEYHGRLSISGVEGPKKNGNCEGSCGQIYDTLKEDLTLNPQLEHIKILDRFIEIWKEWHLNDMTAGSPAQEEWIKKNKKEIEEDLKNNYNLDHYTYVSERLQGVGLNPDKNFMYKDNPYCYGHAWLFREVPTEVLSFLQSLPDSDKKPAWI